jgi:hypothetical protein
MAEETKTKKRRLHLHEIRSTWARDGSIVHHHTYKESKESPDTMPERGPAATSASPDDAGQHVQEQFAMNQGAGGGEPDGDEQPPQPQPGGGGGMLG